MGLEDRLGVTLPDELTDGVETVEDIHDGVARSLGREPKG